MRLQSDYKLFGCLFHSKTACHVLKLSCYIKALSNSFMSSFVLLCLSVMIISISKASQITAAPIEKASSRHMRTTKSLINLHVSVHLKNIRHCSMGLCKVKNVMRLCGCSGVFCIRTRGDTLRKHAYSNMLKILPPKIEKFQIENSDIFHISAQNIEI